MSGRVKSTEYGFEVFEQEGEKNAVGENAACIQEEALADLKYTDVTGNSYIYVKRFFDIVCSFIALVILLVPFLIVSLIIFVDDPGPILFIQNRVGLYGKRFKLCKFRSMRVHAPKYKASCDLEDSHTYITRVGKIMRKLSIDELPQLFNVLLGHMSLVGPRPLISDEYEIHKLRTRYGVYNIRPGITGLAQINGRDTVNVVDKVRFDVDYLKSFGLASDLRIIFSTIPKVFGAKGIVEGKSKKLGM